ncbi:Glycosyl transferase family 2 [Flexibacter flexilis DSM 6793]|uniref:Glycosyl transferase family 2 n=1 Tax=Flexibacter flexilis DSM 6793 TaxID=927664 RepID=A0A1I1DRW6_9BACT|nr:glycosyltransferase [Flexibacter flexilis]SFB75440.1 Glycosyl transferase family 2 [Flexibacter flexilis DSM 6793]
MMKVSVCMITYNHEQYIAQAIESIIGQQTDFDYELIIGEDCSKDGTRSICVDYQQKYPDKIKLVLHNPNVGMLPNFLSVLDKCEGEFVAMCEGDDYWTDVHKLQKQVDFFNKNPDYTVNFHSLQLMVNGEIQTPAFLPKNTFSIEDLIKSNFIGTASVMFRFQKPFSLPNWFVELPFGDWTLHIINANKGKVGYLPEHLGVYRIHAGGNWSNARASALKQELVKVKFYNHISHYLASKYDRVISVEKIKLWNNILNHSDIAIPTKEIITDITNCLQSFGKIDNATRATGSKSNRKTG